MRTEPGIRCQGTAADEDERVGRRLRAVGHEERVSAQWAARLRRLADRYLVESSILKDDEDARDALQAAIDAELLADDVLHGWRPMPDRRSPRAQAG